MPQRASGVAVSGESRRTTVTDREGGRKVHSPTRRICAPTRKILIPVWQHRNIDGASRAAETSAAVLDDVRYRFLHWDKL